MAYSQFTIRRMPRVTSRYDLLNRRTARIKADGSTDLFRYDPAGQVALQEYKEKN